MTTNPVMSITDEQIAEIERKASDKEAEGFSLVHNLPCETILALISRLRAAETDAARYRWLTEQAWFQQAMERFDIDDNGLIVRFKSECARIIDEEIGEKP